MEWKGGKRIEKVRNVNKEQNRCELRRGRKEVRAKRRERKVKIFMKRRRREEKEIYEMKE